VLLSRRGARSKPSHGCDGVNAASGDRLMRGLAMRDMRGRLRSTRSCELSGEIHRAACCTMDVLALEILSFI